MTPSARAAILAHAAPVSSDPAIGPCPALPDDAYTLHVLATATGWSWWYEAHLERPGVDGLRVMVEQAWRLGYVYDYRQADDALDWADVAVLDILDSAGDLIHDLAIPTAEAFAWWERAAELRCYESHAEPVGASS